MSEYIAKASIEPRDYRVVFLIQKEQTVFIHLLFKGFQFFYRKIYFKINRTASTYINALIFLSLNLPVRRLIPT